MNYISYSLWGSEPVYNVGIVRNAEQSKIFYKYWRVVVYYDSSVPIDTITKLQSLDVLCIDVTNLNLYGMFWRFLAADLKDSEYVIFRDADSRLSEREKLAVNEWINSGKTLHVMRDHPLHKIPYGNNSLGILGGMWGIKGGVLKMTEMIYNFPGSKINQYGNDQAFLKIIYSIFQSDKFVHDEFYEKYSFPIPRENGRFVGERMDVNDNPTCDDYKILLNN